MRLYMSVVLVGGTSCCTFWWVGGTFLTCWPANISIQLPLQGRSLRKRLILGPRYKFFWVEGWKMLVKFLHSRY